MSKEVGQIISLRAQSATFSSLAEKRAQQTALLEETMFQSESIDETLRLNEIITRIPARIDGLNARAQEAQAKADAEKAKADARLEQMAQIPALAAKYNAFKAEIDALDPIVATRTTTATEAELDAIFPLAMPYPTFGFGFAEPEQEAQASTTPKSKRHEKGEGSFTRGTAYTVELQGTPYTTTSSREKVLLEAYNSGVTDKKALAQLIWGQVNRSTLNNVAAIVAKLNPQLAKIGKRLGNVGEMGAAKYDLIDLVRPEPEVPPTPWTTSSIEELVFEEPEMPIDPIGPEEYLEDDGLSAILPETPAEDESTLAAVRNLLASEANKRGYVKTGLESLYKKRDLTIYLRDGDETVEITIKDAPGFPAMVVDLIQAGVNTKTGIANSIYPENDPKGRNKISTIINQGVARMLVPYGLTVINLTSQADQKRGTASNFQIVKLTNDQDAIQHEITAENLTDESSETIELTDYEAGIVAVLFEEPLIQEALSKLGIDSLSKDAVTKIQKYLPFLSPSNRPQNGEMNQIRINILTKLGDIYNQRIEGDIFDRSGIGAGILMEFFVGLDKTQREQTLEVLTAHLRKKVVGTHTAHKYGVVDPLSMGRQYADLGPEGRPARPDEVPARAKRTRTVDYTLAPVGLTGIVRSGDFKTIEAQRATEAQVQRDLRHRIVTNSQPTPPVYTDAVVAKGPQAIATARAEAVASADLPRAQAEAVEAAEILPRKFNAPIERRVEISKEFDALRGFRFDFEAQIETILDGILINIPELASNPSGMVGSARLTQVFRNLTTTSLNKYEEINALQATKANGIKKYTLASILSVRFYREFDPYANRMSNRARKQLRSAIEKAVEARIARIQESASK